MFGPVSFPLLTVGLWSSVLVSAPPGSDGSGTESEGRGGVCGGNTPEGWSSFGLIPLERSFLPYLSPHRSGFPPVPSCPHPGPSPPRFDRYPAPEVNQEDPGRVEA